LNRGIETRNIRNNWEREESIGRVGIEIRENGRFIEID